MQFSFGTVYLRQVIHYDKLATCKLILLHKNQTRYIAEKLLQIVSWREAGLFTGRETAIDLKTNRITVDQNGSG